MKRFFCLVLVVLFALTAFSSCEKRCTCTYDDGTEEIIYNAYSKKECNEWDDYINNELNTKVSCTYKKIK